MSGVFRPEQNATVEATDDPALAEAHGLTEWDAERGQYVAPATSNASSAELPDEGGASADEVAAYQKGRADAIAESEATPADEEPATGETAHFATPDEGE